MNRRPCTYALMALICAASSATANAASCTLSVSDLTFGNYVAGQSAALDSTASIRIDCSNDDSAQTVGYNLSLGRSGNGAYDPRALRGDDGELRYNLYIDASRALIFGDGNDGTLDAAGQIALPAQRHSEHLVYGRINGGQQTLPGIYSDVLIVELNY